MKRIPSLLITIATIFYLIAMSACQTKCHQNPPFNIFFDGFDSLEQSKVVIEEYKGHTNFTELTAVYVRDTMDFVSNDTTYSKGYYYPINTEHDYIINLPLAGRTFKVRDLAYHQISGPYPGSDWNCANAASWYVNDSLEQYDGIPPTKHLSNQYATIDLKK